MLEILDISTDSLTILASTWHFAKRQRKKNGRYPEEVWDSIIKLAEGIPKVKELSGPDLMASLEESKSLNTEAFRNSIHEGETVLIIATRGEANFFLLTGDKNCLTALPQIPQPIYQRLCGRVICLEQIILKLIDMYGFEAIAHRLLPNLSYDKSLQLCFGYSEPAPETQVRENLLSCINALNRQAPGLLRDW